MKILYCIQNTILEEVLKKKRIINKNSLIIRDRKELTYKKVLQINPDFIMFPHWSYIVPQNIVSNFKCICFHSSPLPYGRGGSPIQNMIKRGYKNTEVCSLLMEKELDTGPIYLRSKVKLSGSLDEILLRIYEAVANQIKVIKNKKIIPKVQTGKEYIFKRLNTKDNQVNFKDSMEKIYDQIRMLDSSIYPSAFLGSGNHFINFKNARLKDKDTLVAEVIIKRKITIRKAKISDSKSIWKWRNDPLTRSMFINKDYIEYKDHLKWFKSKLKNKNSFIFIGQAFEKNVGMVRIDVSKNIGEISININPKFRGISLSETLLSDAIQTFRKKKPNCTLVADIDKKNTASIKIFSSIGFIRQKATKNIYRFRLNFEQS